MNNGSFIPDGYTRNGYIAASEEWGYSALSFEYRPMVMHERVRAQEQIEKSKDAVAGETVSQKIVAGRINNWNLEHNGSPVEPTPENIARLEPHLSYKLFMVVMGFESDDSGSKPDQDQEGDDLKN